MAMMNVSLSDPTAELVAIRAELDVVVKEMMDSEDLSDRSAVERFEAELAGYLGATHVVGTNSGPAALRLALMALGVGPGHGVVVPANISVADAAAVIDVGAHLFLVDIDLYTATMDPVSLRGFLQDACVRDDSNVLVHKDTKTPVKAVMPIHEGGLPAEMASLLHLIHSSGLWLVENVSCAAGAAYRTLGGWYWQKAGTLGDVAVFSFSPGANLGAVVDAGAAVTGSVDLAERMRWLLDIDVLSARAQGHSRSVARTMSPIQATVLSCKLKRLDAWNQARQWAAEMYRQALGGLPVVLPLEPPYARHVFNSYEIRSPQSHELVAGLPGRGVQVDGRRQTPLYGYVGYEHTTPKNGHMPNIEQAASTTVALPMHPNLTYEDVHTVILACCAVMNGG
jgi:dTDP-4-amino-4,6-dideoxygalactose transaminase